MSSPSEWVKNLSNKAKELYGDLSQSQKDKFIETIKKLVGAREQVIEDVRSGGKSYFVLIQGRGNVKDIRVMGRLKNPLNYSIRNNWDVLMGGGTFPKIGNFMSAGGVWTGELQKMGRNRFTGSDHLSFGLEMEFIVNSNPYKDMLDPIRALEMLSTPLVDSEFFKPIVPAAISIGNWIYVNEAAITNLDITYSDKLVTFDGEDFPAKGMISLTVMIPEKLSQQDLQAMWVGRKHSSKRNLPNSTVMQAIAVAKKSF